MSAKRWFFFKFLRANYIHRPIISIPGASHFPASGSLMALLGDFADGSLSHYTIPTYSEVRPRLNLILKGKKGKRAKG